METQVLQELRFVKEKLRKWDEDFFTKNDRLPNNDYMGDDDFKELSRKKKAALKLLESWNITIHVS